MLTTVLEYLKITQSPVTDNPEVIQASVDAYTDVKENLPLCIREGTEGISG